MFIACAGEHSYVAVQLDNLVCSVLKLNDEFDANIHICKPTLFDLQGIIPVNGMFTFLNVGC
jgi:hypothetical protein